MLWKTIGLFKRKFVLFVHKDFFGISTFFLQIIEEKKQHHLELRLKKKIASKVQDWGIIKQESKFKKELGFPVTLENGSLVPREDWEIWHPGEDVKLKDYVLPSVYDLSWLMSDLKACHSWDYPETLLELLPSFILQIQSPCFNTLWRRDISESKCILKPQLS